MDVLIRERSLSDKNVTDTKLDRASLSTDVFIRPSVITSIRSMLVIGRIQYMRI